MLPMFFKISDGTSLGFSHVFFQISDGTSLGFSHV